MNKIKEISYAYPSSPIANRVGMVNGCYCVAYITPSKSYKSFKTEVLKTFKTLEEAKAFSDTFPEKYSNFSL